MYACIDMGGTAIKVAVSDELGNLEAKESLVVHHDFDLLINSLVEWIETKKQQYSIEGIAISSPGAVDSVQGIVGGSSAIPCIHGPNWKNILKEKTGLNVSIENDANCAALAEVFSGTAKEVKDMMFIVCGSGVGGAIIKDGKIHKGANLFGGEFGYMIMEYVDSKPVTLSDCASTMSFVRKARSHYQDNSINGLEVFKKAEDGDAYCKEVIHTFYFNLAKGIFNLQHVFDPEMILLGGAISDRSDFVERINECLKQIIKEMEIACAMPYVSKCTHTKDANIIGALANYLTEYK